MEIYLTDKDIEDIEIDPTDEWDVESQSIMVHIGHNLYDRLVNSFALTEEEKEGFENDGWLDVYAEFDIDNKAVNRLYVVAFLGYAEKTLSFELRNDPLHSYNGDCLYEKFCKDESFVEFTEEILEYQKELKQTDFQMLLDASDHFQEALDIFKKAFENLRDAGSSVYINDEVFDGNDNYPFDRSFDEMPEVVEAWVESVKKRIQIEFIHGTYNVTTYMSSIVPEWRGESNLISMEIEGVVLYDWYVEKVAPIENPGEKVSPEVFNYWIENVQDADMVEGLYEYAKAKGGLISIVSWDEV